MILYTNGCSMTWGDDLTQIVSTNEKFKSRDEYAVIVKEMTENRPGNQQLYRNFDVVVGNDDKYRTTHNWPAILGRKLECTEVHNEAYPGGSNQRMIRTSMDWIAGNKDKDVLVVIGWTGLNRMELWSEEFNMHSPHLLNFSANYSKEDRKFFEKYWRESYNDYDSVDSFLHQLIMFQSFLQANNIPFIFFDALPTVHKAKLDMSVLTHLEDLIDKDRYLYYNTPNHCFFTWCKANNLPFGERMHPLEEAHEAWANVIYSYIMENDLLNV